MIARTIGLAVALAVAIALAPCAAAADAPEPVWSLENPFCGVLAAVVPASKPGDYGMALYARTGVKVEAHVTLVGDSAAYDAHVPATNLQGDLTDRHTDADIIHFASPTPLRYFFVDSYSIDGGAETTCPSYVFRSGSGPNDDQMTGMGLTVVEPAMLQALPALPCGKVYTEPDIRKGLEAIVGRYGGDKRETVLNVYVDSNGHEIQASLKKSSGVEGLDDAALGEVQLTLYKPATFLCTPVVSELEMTVEYRP